MDGLDFDNETYQENLMITAWIAFCLLAFATVQLALAGWAHVPVSTAHAYHGRNAGVVAWKCGPGWEFAGSPAPEIQVGIVGANSDGHGVVITLPNLFWEQC